MARWSLPGFDFGFQADYFTERLIRIYTVLLFIILSITIALDLGSSHGMTCWTPAQFTQQHVAYTNQICMQSSNLYLPLKESMPSPSADLISDPSQVYGQNFSKIQVLPILLAFQALLFLLPWLLWRFVSVVGYNLQTVIRDSSRTPLADLSSALHSNPLVTAGPIAGGYVLPFLYLLVKFLNFAVCLVQMVVISAYFNINFFVYKSQQALWEPYRFVNVTSKVETVDNNTEIMIHRDIVTPFPRVVLCEFQMRHQGRVHSYMVQCSVGMADTVEHCLAVIWIWLVILLLLLVFSGLCHLLITLFWCLGPQAYKKAFLTKRLRSCESFDLASPQLVQKFCNLLLKPDVFFVVGMIEENGSMAAGSEVIRAFWEGFLKTSKIRVDQTEGMMKEREALME